jgi:hypothetical protein
MNFTALAFAWAYSEDFTVVGFFSSRTWQDDTASGFLFFFAATDYDAVMQRTKLHCRSLLIVVFIGRCSPGGFNKSGLRRLRFVERTAED